LTLALIFAAGMVGAQWLKDFQGGLMGGMRKNSDWTAAVKRIGISPAGTAENVPGRQSWVDQDLG
jgi:hypothetical protein